MFGGGSRMPRRRRRLRISGRGIAEDAGPMTPNRDDVAGPIQGTRVAGTPDPQPAGTEHDPAGAAVDRELARYGLGPKDVDDTDD
jgi:hypothetical protein